MYKKEKNAKEHGNWSEGDQEKKLLCDGNRDAVALSTALVWAVVAAIA